MTARGTSPRIGAARKQHHYRASCRGGEMADSRVVADCQHRALREHAEEREVGLPGQIERGRADLANARRE